MKCEYTLTQKLSPFLKTLAFYVEYPSVSKYYLAALPDWNCVPQYFLLSFSLSTARPVIGVLCLPDNDFSNLVSNSIDTNCLCFPNRNHFRRRGGVTSRELTVGVRLPKSLKKFVSFVYMPFSVLLCKMTLVIPWIYECNAEFCQGVLDDVVCNSEREMCLLEAKL